MHRDERRATCPHCGQLLLGVRFGVALGAFRARIVDVVKRAGPDGIDTESLADLIYADRPAINRQQALKSNIHLINGLLVSTDMRLRAQRETISNGRGRRGRAYPVSVCVYRLVKE